MQSLKATGQTLLENIKTVVNLFVRRIGCSSTLRLLMSPYLMKRVTRVGPGAALKRSSSCWC